MRSILCYFSAAALLAAGVVGSDVATADWPTITPPPVPNALLEFELRKRATIDPASLAAVLLTALPLSLQLLAATNLPSASHVIWSEFLDNNKPDWFTALPSDIKSYLVEEYGPSTAWASSTPTSLATSASSTASAGSVVNAASTATSSAASAHHGGLSPSAKIGLGVGVPLVVLLIVASLLACCLLHRRRKQKQRHGERPPTPGFIPTSTRHGHSTSSDRVARYPLRGGASSVPLSADTSGWDNADRDSGLGGIGGPSYEHSLPPPAPPYHRHSASGSRGSRGSRTSLSSLHSVPEVPEHLHDHGHHGLPIPPPPRSPRRRSLGGDTQLPPALVAGSGERERRRSSGGPSPLNPAFGMSKAEEAHAESAGRHAHQLPPNHAGQGIYAGQRNPFADEHSSSEEDFVLAPEQAEMRQVAAPYGRGWAQQVEGERAELHTPANEWTHAEWPLRNEVYQQHLHANGRPMSLTYDRVYDGH